MAKKPGPKCSICPLPNVDHINSQITKGVSFRNVALLTNSSHMSVYRHAETCLGLDIGSIFKELKKVQIVNVYEEFRENLDFAKQLRRAAKEYLSTADDPDRIDIIPRTSEIDITYYDRTELNEFGKPRKKTNTLAFLLDEVESKSDMETVRVTIKHMDMRKFALEAMDRADMCIDKFARIDGDYTKDKNNPRDLTVIAQEVAAALKEQHGWTDDQVNTYMLAKYPAQDVSNANN